MTMGLEYKDKQAKTHQHTLVTIQGAGCNLGSIHSCLSIDQIRLLKVISTRYIPRGAPKRSFINVLRGKENRWLRPLLTNNPPTAQFK
jgi:hypothetical protein